MRGQAWCHFILVVLLISSARAHVPSEKLRILTTEYQPYSFEEFGEAKGFSVEIVKALLKKVGIEQRIEVFPWARTYQTALNRPNTLIFSIARTSQREEHFHWIGKLFPMKTYFYVASDRNDIEINAIEDVHKYVVSGVIEGAPSKWLAAQGVEMFNSTGLYDSRIKMLISHRIDVLISDPMSIETEMQQANIDIQLVKPILYLPEPSYDLYLAFSLGTKQSYIDTFRQAYVELHDSGEFEKLTKAFDDKYRHLSIPQ